jgi:hypothetical protein
VGLADGVPQTFSGQRFILSLVAVSTRQGGAIGDLSVDAFGMKRPLWPFVETGFGNPGVENIPLLCGSPRMLQFAFKDARPLIVMRRAQEG